MFGGGEDDITEIKKTNDNKSKYILIEQGHLSWTEVSLWDKSWMLTAASRRFAHHSRRLSTEYKPQPLFLVHTLHCRVNSYQALAIDWDNLKANMHMLTHLFPENIKRNSNYVECRRYVELLMSRRYLQNSLSAAVRSRSRICKRSWKAINTETRISLTRISLARKSLARISYTRISLSRISYARIRLYPPVAIPSLSSSDSSSFLYNEISMSSAVFVWNLTDSS